MNKYQNALDRLSNIDLDRVLEVVNYDYETAALISDYDFVACLKEIKTESSKTTETIKERIDNLIADYQERIKAEKHFMDMNIEDMKRIVVAVGVSSIEGMCGNIARQIDKQEIEINMMECFVNELKWADLGEDNAKGNS